MKKIIHLRGKPDWSFTGHLGKERKRGGGLESNQFIHNSGQSMVIYMSGFTELQISVLCSSC